MTTDNEKVEVLRRRCRIVLVMFVIGLVLSGFTAMPLRWEVNILNNVIGEGTFMEDTFPPMAQWISRVYAGLLDVGEKWPFMYYGTDWVFFAHIVIATAFIGPLRDPVQNIWVIQWAMLACVLVFPMVFIFAPVRGIPLFWQLIDCSFGVVGIIPLAICHGYVRQMQKLAV